MEMVPTVGLRRADPAAIAGGLDDERRALETKRVLDGVGGHV